MAVAVARLTNDIQEYRIRRDEPFTAVAGRTDQALADRTANALCEQSAAGQRGRPRQSRRVDAPMGVAKIDHRQLRQLTGGPHVLMPRGTGISNPPRPAKSLRTFSSS